MKMLVMVLLMTFGRAFAATNTYNIKMNLSIKGKNNYPTQIIAEDGKATTVTQKSNGKDEETFVDVITTKKVLKTKKEGVSIKFTAGTIDNKGEKHIQFNTQIIAIENQPAQIKEDDLSLSFTASRL
jgi:capsular polysaccharide biosynthesis protein